MWKIVVTDRREPVPIRVVHGLSSALMAIGAVALLAMILLSAADVIYRNVAGVGVSGSIQLNEMFMVVMTFGALAATQMRDGHVAVDIAAARLSPRIANVLQAAGLLVTAAVTAWGTWASWHVALEALHRAEVSIGIVNMPTWPTRFLVSVGLALLTAELVISAVQPFRNQTVTHEADIDVQVGAI